MRATVYIFLGILTASSLGCDGHTRLLYLQQPGMENPPWNVTSTMIAVSGEEDVPRLLKDVAAQLGLTYDSRSAGYTVAVNDHGGSFTMSAAQEANGRWVIRLLDWPSFTRSPHSIAGETAIRTALKSGKYHVGGAVGMTTA